jgi:hypothetical protein
MSVENDPTRGGWRGRRVGKAAIMTETLSNAYALVVGIALYPSIRKLPYTEDANDVAALLADVEVCGYTSVAKLSEAEATRGAILDGLDRLADVPEGSTVLIYFSGHGASLADGAYLLPYEAVHPEDDDLRRTSISGALLTEKLGKIARRAERLTVILDCCHAGGIGDLYEAKHIGAGVKPGLSEDMVASLGTGKGRAIFAAALPDRPAFVREGARHGQFTQCLINGLRGGAQGRQGVIRIGDLMSHLRDCLSKAGSPQEPYFKLEGTDYPIARHLGGKEGSGAVVKGGLEALIRLAADPQIRAEILGIQGRLKAAYNQIGTVVGLKALHDRLHDIEVSPYEQILNERPRLPDPTASANVARYARRVGREIDPMRKAAGRAYAAAAGPVEWIDAMQGAVETLVRGVQEASLDAIDDGIWAINDVLRVVPYEINEQLVEHVRDMDLGALFRALLRVQGRMEDLRVPADEARRFAAGGRDLGRLDRDFQDLMEQHDGWQQVDNRMRLIESNGRGNPRELDSAWPQLSKQFSVLLDAVPESRRGELRDAADQVADRLAKKADREAKVAAFRDLRDAATQWFYDLDKTLKERCDELELINAALGSVLEIVMGADS